MKKVMKFIWWAFIGWIGFKLVHLFKQLSAYGKVICFGAISNPKDEKLLPESSYALIFSALHFDLSNHQMVSENATIKIFGLFSAFDLVVPENWKIELSGTSDKSDVKNSSKCEDDDAPKLFIEHNLKFSALNIRTKASTEKEETL